MAWLYFLSAAALVPVIIWLARRSLAEQRRDLVRGAGAPSKGTPPRASGEPDPGPTFSARARSSDSNRIDNQHALRWYGPGDTLEVHGFRIPNPLTYASEERRNSFPGCPSEIVRSYAVRSGVAEPMAYWPWYTRTEPANRWEYLAWMAAGRGLRTLRKAAFPERKRG